MAPVLPPQLCCLHRSTIDPDFTCCFEHIICSTGFKRLATQVEIGKIRFFVFHGPDNRGVAIAANTLVIMAAAQQCKSEYYQVISVH